MRVPLDSSGWDSEAMDSAPVTNKCGCSMTRRAKRVLAMVKADPHASISDIQDARRLIEIAISRPRDFQARLLDFLAWRERKT